MSPLARAVDRVFWAYQKVSAGTSPRCRFDPTCSQYGREAVATHGAFRGLWFALRRIGRCHPWGGQGYDPVPTSGPASSPSSPRN